MPQCPFRTSGINVSSPMEPAFAKVACARNGTFGLVVSRYVANDEQAVDLFVSDREVVRQDQFIGEVGPVEVTVVASPDNNLAMVADHFGDLNSHVITYHLLDHPAPYSVDTPKLPTSVVDESVGCEGCNGRVLVERPYAWTPTDRLR